jgi:hypothetical protein
MGLTPIISTAKLWFCPDEITDNPKSPSLDDFLCIEDEVIGGRPNMEVTPFGREIRDR